MAEIKTTFPAAVVRVIDSLTLVINRGSDDGVSKGDSFLVYYVEPEEMLDPTTGESLGHLEIVRGSGAAVHVQPKMSTIRSNRTESGGRIVRRTSGGLLGIGLGETVEHPEKKAVPFENPEVGDLAKPI